MVFPIGPVRSAPYEIDYSLDLNGSNEYLSRRPSTAGSERVATYRFLFKRRSTSGTRTLVRLPRTTSTGSHAVLIRFQSNSRLWVSCENNSAGPVFSRQTTRAFNSTSAWYDLCVQIDGNRTGDSCCTIEVDGVEITSFVTKKNLSTPTDLNLFNTARTLNFGQHANSNYFDGLISGDSLIVDGTNYDAGKFGETVNGVWRPKRFSGINYGTNGVLFDFADGANLGNDVSGNNNDFTSHNITSADQSTDTPTS